MAYEEHRRLDLKALQVTDATIYGAREVWLGYDGTGGQWLTPEHFREHVAALAKFAEGLPALPASPPESLAGQAGDEALLRLAFDALTAEFDPAWQCNSYHPKVWMALNALKTRFATPAPAALPAVPMEGEAGTDGVAATPAGYKLAPLKAVALATTRGGLKDGDCPECFGAGEFESALHCESCDKCGGTGKRPADVAATPMADLPGMAREAALLAIAQDVCLQVAELPDRDSPEDWPEAMLVTHEELLAIVRRALADGVRVSPHQEPSPSPHPPRTPKDTEAP